MHKVLQELSQDNECLHPWKGRLKFSRLETQSHATLLPSEHYYPAVHSQLRQLSSCISLCTLFAEPRIDKQVNWNKMQRSVRTQTFFIHSSKADMLYSLTAVKNNATILTHSPRVFQVLLIYITPRCACSVPQMIPAVGHEWSGAREFDHHHVANWYLPT